MDARSLSGTATLPSKEILDYRIPDSFLRIVLLRKTDNNYVGSFTMEANVLNSLFGELLPVDLTRRYKQFNIYLIFRYLQLVPVLAK